MTPPASEADPFSFSLSLFGPMQVLIGGQPISPLRSRKSLWLLALLTLRRGRPVERAWLAGALWPDAYQDQAAANLNPVLSDLRRALGGQVVRLQPPSRHTLRLDLAGAAVDVAEFDAAIVSQKPEALERAVALYRGPLLEDCAEEWVPQERNAREQDCLRALGMLAESALTAGEHGKAADYSRRAVQIAPRWEAAQRGLMQALAQEGDGNAALEVYQAFLRLLHKDDPRAVPDEKTTALYRHLRAEMRRRASTPAKIALKDAAAPVVTGYLPHPLTDLIGREGEREEVAEQLRRARLVTLTGPGGIGKTRLALAVTEEAAPAYADGVWLVALESLSNRVMVSRQIAILFGLKEEPGRSCLYTVAAHLRGKRLLLVLDNCEHILEASAEVAAHLLRECAGVRILATSREALGITGEAAWAVPALPVPNPAHLPPSPATLVRVLMGYEGVQLFVERAQAVCKTFELTKENAGAVAQICARLEGIPLAIELAAARVRAMPVTQIATHLNDQLNLLTGNSRAAMSRQQTLRGTLNWSYDLLLPPERQLLACLSAFAGGCEIKAAEEVCAGEGIEARQILDILTSLADKSLVVFEEKPNEPNGRYRLLEMVRQYAAGKLQDCHDAERVKTRHLNWCVALAERATPYLVGADQAMWLNRLETEYDNMRAALGQAALGQVGDAGSELGLRLSAALWRFWYVRGYYQEARFYLEQSIERAGVQEATAARAKALNGVGNIAYSQSDFPAARVYFTEALTIRRRLSDKPGIARTLAALGHVLRMQGEVDATQSLYEESLRLSQEIGDKNSAAWTIFNLAGLAHERGEVEAANIGFYESRRLFQELDDKGGIAWSLYGLAERSAYQGDFTQAQELNAECHDLFTELGDKQGIAWSVHNLGDMFYQQRQRDAAQATFEEALRLLKDLGDRRGIALSFNGLGRLACDRGELTSARTLHAEALKLSRELGEQRSIAYSLLCAGIAAISQGDIQEAQTNLEESLTMSRTLSDHLGIAESLLYLANLKILLNDYDMARTHFAASLNLLRKLGHKTLTDECLRRLETVSKESDTP